MNAANVLWPAGPIRAAWFTADQSAPEIIGVWIAQAEAAGASGESDILIYVEFQTYTMMAERLASNPISQSRDNRSETHAVSQITFWQDKADNARARWEAVTGINTVRSATTAATNRFVW